MGRSSKEDPSLIEERFRAEEITPMRRYLAFAALALALGTFPLSSSGQTNGEKDAAGRPESVGTEKEIRSLENQLREAAMKSDTAFFEHYWADDYFRTNSFGRIHDKAQALDNFKRGDLKYEALNFQDVKVRIYGDTAVVTALAQIRGQYQDERLEGDYRHTRVWVKRPAGWQVVAFHASRIDLD